MGKALHGKKLFPTMGLVFLALTGLGTAPARAAASAPRVAVKESVYDFGRVTEDQRLLHTFIIGNEGSKPLRIEDVDPECACTVANYPKVIPPGGQGRLTLAIKPYSVIHGFEKKTKVTFNDPETPVMVFTLKGVAQPFIEIEPSHIVRLRGAPGDQVQGQVRFTSHLTVPWKITSWHTNIPDKIAVNLKAEVPDKVYVLTVTNKSRDAGAYGGLIELSTTSVERPRLIVRVFGNLYLPSAGNR